MVQLASLRPWLRAYESTPKARWDLVESPSRFSSLIEHDLFGKPLHTFPDHAPAYCLRMIFSDLPSPAEASGHEHSLRKGFAQAENRHTLFRITR
jgi:hypothetical protein